MALADDDPHVQELLAYRAPARIPARELRAELGLGALLLVAIAALALVGPSDRDLGPAAAVGLVAAYALAQQVRFHVGAGYTVPSQLVMVPMLVLAPPALVPALVAAGLVVGRLPHLLRGELDPARAAFALPDAWHAVAPAAVIAALAPAHPGLDDWPVVALALVAQSVFDAGFGVLRAWLAIGVAPQLQLRLMAWIYAADAALAPIGFLAGVAGAREPLAVAAVLPLMGLFAFFARER